MLVPARRRYPALQIVFEHITTHQAVTYVNAAGGRSRGGAPLLGATITAHHLLFNRNALFLTARGQTGVRPHFYCLPVLKREVHREALLGAATSGDARFFLGTDSAPHPRGDKENDCACAGCFTAASAMEMYAAAFDSVGALDRLEGFASFFGADFYRLPRNRDRVALERREWVVPGELKFGASTVVPLGAGEPLAWTWIG